MKLHSNQVSKESCGIPLPSVRILVYTPFHLLSMCVSLVCMLGNNEYNYTFLKLGMRQERTKYDSEKCDIDLQEVIIWCAVSFQGVTFLQQSIQAGGQN